MNRNRVETVRRRLVEAAYAEGVNMLHAHTHLHRSLIATLLELAQPMTPDPPMFLLGLYDGWKAEMNSGEYVDFVTYAKARMKS